jgi:hypothetical protein
VGFGFGFGCGLWVSGLRFAVWGLLCWVRSRVLLFVGVV